MNPGAQKEVAAGYGMLLLFCPKGSLNSPCG